MKGTKRKSNACFFLLRFLPLLYTFLFSCTHCTEKNQVSSHEPRSWFTKINANCDEREEKLFFSFDEKKKKKVGGGR